MHFRSVLVALAATSSFVSALPIPQSDDDCIGSSFSPTNCNSPGADSINVDPAVDIAPTIAPLERRNDEAATGSDDDCIGSSFSPTNCNSPGANSINVGPDVDVSPDVALKEKRQFGSSDATKYTSNDDEDVPDNDCIGSSFSPTNCNSPGANSINLDPAINLSPNVGGEKREKEQPDSQEQPAAQSEPESEQAGSDDDCVGSSFSPTNCNSPGANSINVKPDVDVSPTVDLGDGLLA